jgi:hypothetical protein
MTEAITQQRIIAIYGMEPLRDQESPTAFVVGTAGWAPGAPGAKIEVERIERREENFGDHGILWFDVYGTGESLPFVSMQGRAVAEVCYAWQVQP